MPWLICIPRFILMQCTVGKKGSKMVPSLVTIATPLLVLFITILMLKILLNGAIEPPFMVLISTFSNGANIVTKLLLNRTFFSSS